MSSVFRKDAANFAGPAQACRTRRFALRGGLGALLVVIFGSGCATVSAPVLKQATGETLGVKKFRILAHYEMSRIFAPGTPQGGTAGVAQNSSVFRGSYFGVQADGGVLPQLDLQLGANFTASGGGWRTGAKYQFYKGGRFALAGMLGYAAASGTGTLQYLTDSTPQEFTQTLSAYTVDVSIPMSIRATPWFVVYGGPMWLRSGVSGSFGGNVVSDTFNDFGTNLGFQVTSWIFTGSLEGAALLVKDPFTDSIRTIPYLGVSFGVVF